jgi:hypothetical protein
VADGICNNCGASLLGDFCHRCGQQEVDDWKSIGSIARHFWDELVSFDFKAARSVAALAYPGRLAAEFIAGRRRSYLSPLRVYFLTAAVFFVVAPRLTDFSFERQFVLDAEFRTRVEDRLALTGMSRELFAERFNRNLQTVYTLAPILSVLATTLILRFLYRQTLPWLGPHAVFAFYYVAFLYLIALIIHGMNDVFGGPNLVLLLALQYLLMAPYVFLALRRVYGEPDRPTLRKTLVVLVCAFVIDSPINIGAARLCVALT